MYLKVLAQKNQDGHVRKYLQIVESRRVNGSPRQVVLASLGRIDTEEGEKQLQKLASSLIEATSRLKLLNLAEDLKALNTREYGPALVFRRLWQELGLEKVIRRELESGSGAEFDVTETLFNMVLNRLSEPGSKRQLTLWEQDIEGVQSFELHQYYRALDYAIDHKDGIEKGVFEQMKSLFHQSVDVVLFDTTSLVYYGDSDEHEELLAYGFSKARRSDLKQIIVGVLMSKQGIPLGHEVFEGNKNDVTCFREMLQKISAKFQIGKVICVGDRGMISKENLEYLKKHHYAYILGYRMRTIPKRYRKRIFEKASFRKLKNLELEFSEQSYEGQRLVVCYSAERAEKDAKHRQDVLDRIEKKLKSGSIHALIDNAAYKRFLKIRGDRPVLDPEKVTQDSCYDGIFVLTTNTELPSVQVVQAYKDLWQVELAFRQLKSELEMGPIYHWKDRRIRAHILICFLAFVLRTALYRKLKEKNKEVSYAKTLQDLKSLRSVELEVAGSKIRLRTELKSGAAQAFEAIGMRAPNRFLSSELPNSVVVRH